MSNESRRTQPDLATLASQPPASVREACRYCGNALNARAILCPDCSHYQSRWRNWLPHLGTGITLISVATAALTFTADSLSKRRREHFGVTSVVPITFSDTGDCVVLNNGDHDILLEQVFFRANDFHHDTWVTINKVVKSGDLLVHKPELLPTPFTPALPPGVETTHTVRNLNGEIKEFVVTRSPHASAFQPRTVHGLSPVEIDSLKQIGRTGIDLSEMWLTLSFLDEDNPDLKVFRAQTASGPIAEFPGTASISYTRLSTGERFQKEVGCSVVLLSLPADDGSRPFDDARPNRTRN